jgi:AcrR family transcriptional regulator
VAVSGRASAGDWCAAGLALLRDEGIEAVTVDRLCAALGKTKGSFYHHFADLEAYLAELLARWEDELTDGPIRSAELEPDPRRRGARLDQVVRGLDHHLDGAVRAWAFWDPRARAAMKRVDGRRLAYLTLVHRQRGHHEPARLAELEYATFVGAQQLGILADESAAARLESALGRALAALSRDPGRRVRRERGAGPRRR